MNWKEKGLKLRQETSFPEQDKVILKITENKGYNNPIYLRYPTWIESTVSIQINGESIPVDAKPGEYICLNKDWKTGDEITVELPQTFRLEPSKDDPYMNAILKLSLIHI